MRTLAAFGTAAIVLALASLESGGGDQVVLLDGPQGAWLASVRGDAAMTIVEERDGWRRVRLEGWVPVAGPAAASAPAGPTTPGAVPAPVAVPTATGAAAHEGTPSEAALDRPPAEPRSAPSGVTVAGVLTARPGMKPDTPGANLVVRLLGDLEHLDGELRAAGEACRSVLAQSDARVAALEEATQKALNSSNNLTEATQRYDRARSDLAAARKGRAQSLDGCRSKADALLDRYAVGRALSETSGRFEIRGVAPGHYRVVAADHSADGVRSWSIDCDVAGTGPVVLDLATAPEGPDPYWGLR